MAGESPFGSNSGTPGSGHKVELIPVVTLSPFRLT